MGTETPSRLAASRIQTVAMGPLWAPSKDVAFIHTKYGGTRALCAARRPLNVPSDLPAI